MNRGSQRMIWPAFTALGLVLAVLGATLSTPAFAVDGRTAVGTCIDNSETLRCGWAVSKDGSIDVCNKNGCVTCPSATDECKPAAVTHPRGRLTYGPGLAGQALVLDAAAPPSPNPPTRAPATKPAGAAK